MSKVICIGECALDIIFSDGKPAGSMTGGRIANAAAILARKGLPVTFAGEAANDPIGNMVVGFLSDAGVDIKSIDRFTEGHTPLNIFTPGADGSSEVSRYEEYPEEGFDIVWPRVDKGDIVIFGGYYALSPRNRVRMSQLLTHANEMKAIVVYLPGFFTVQAPRITRVMPAILENLEMCQIVMARDNDLKLIFGVDATDKCYADHIDFYCRNLINIDTACRRARYYSGKEVTEATLPADNCESMLWNAGCVAGVAEALLRRNVALDDLDSPSAEFRESILKSAITSGNDTIAAITDDWQKVK